jgi:hypothetical protein
MAANSEFSIHQINQSINRAIKESNGQLINQAINETLHRSIVQLNIKTPWMKTAVFRFFKHQKSWQKTLMATDRAGKIEAKTEAG